MSYRARLVGLSLLSVAGLLPQIAIAGNGIRPRTPVLWNDTQCFEVVDRSVDPIHPVQYDIPFEDTMVTVDEVPDSRTHQFFALCRQFNAQIYIPNWITFADVDAAVMAGIIDSGVIEDANILEGNPDWEGCWLRINADDERRPITNQMAGEPVPWDTSTVPVGTYVLWGYTFEPAFNLWSQRMGSIVKVIDGGDSKDIGPGAAITTREQTPYKGETVTIEGCVDALPGTTMTGYFASTAGIADADWQPEWIPFMEDAAVEGSAFALDFLPPEEVAGETTMVRIDFTDPMDRTYEAHMRENVIVLMGTGMDCESGGNFIGTPGCGDESGSESGASESSGGSGGATDGSSSSADASGEAATEPANDGGEQGCSCATAQGQRSGVVLLLFAILGVARRRRATPWIDARPGGRGPGLSRGHRAR